MNGSVTAFFLFSALCIPAPPDPTWPMRRHDTRLSGRAGARGGFRAAPRVAWTFREDVLEVELQATAQHGGPGDTPVAPLVIEPAKLPPPPAEPPAEEPASQGKKKKRKRPAGALLADLHGDGRLVPDPGKAAKLIPGVKGLQTVTFDAVPGMEASLTRRAVCRAYDGPEPRVAWTSEPFDTVQNTNHVVADLDADGQLEVVLAPHYRVLILDGATGRAEHVLRFHDLRNYGFFCVAQLDADPQLEMVVVADFVLHIDVVDMDASGPRLLWRKDFEEDIQSKRRILRPGPDPVVDLDGDGRKEIVFNLYNDSRDQLWHVVALDALTGEKRLDLPGRYLGGHDDLDGDGARELLVCECPSLCVPLAGVVSVLSWSPGRGPAPVMRWSRPHSRFLTREVDLPLTHSTIVARGTETAATVAPGGGAATGFLVALLDGDREVVSLAQLERDDAVLSVHLPATREVAVRSVTDGEPGKDGGGPAGFALSFRAGATERLELPPPRGGRLEAVCARPIPARATRGADSDGWVTVGTWGGKPAVFTENAMGEVLAVCPPGLTGAPGPAGSRQPAVIWRDTGTGPVILADLDGDGSPEAVYAGASPGGEGHIVAAAPSGRKWVRPIAGFPAPHPPWNYGGVTRWWVGRFTSPARFDIWVSARRGTMHTDEGFLLRGADGALLWQRSEVRTPGMPASTRGWGCGGGSANAADVDGDGLDDVVSLYPVNYSALSGSDGKLLKSVDAASGLFKDVWGAYATPCVADLDGDGDGEPEVFWSGPYHQGVTDLDGKVRWGRKGGTGIATVADLDGDGRLEAASTGWEKDGTGLKVLDARTGDLRWELPLPGNPRIEVTAADLDGETGDELLFATGKMLRAVGASGAGLRELWSVELPAEPQGEIAVADADGDGAAELLYVGRDGTVYCLR